jgi:hypothetical protein
MVKILDALFGCAHKRHTFPMTATRRTRRPSDPAATAGMTYVVCLACGKEFPYDWQQMKLITATKHTRETGAVASCVKPVA